MKGEDVVNVVGVSEHTPVTPVASQSQTPIEVSVSTISDCMGNPFSSVECGIFQDVTNMELGVEQEVSAVFTASTRILVDND